MTKRQLFQRAANIGVDRPDITYSCFMLERAGASWSQQRAWVNKLHATCNRLGYGNPGGPNTPLTLVLVASHVPDGAQTQLRIRLLRAEAYDRPLDQVITNWLKQHRR